jgi:hypothetical protein
MLSVSFQIVGNFLLVFAIISQNFADISNDSAVIIGLDNKKDKIKKKLATKCEIIIGLFWVIIGLTLSIQRINNFIKNISLCENWLFNISLIILLFIISILISKIVPRLDRKKIDAYANKKTEGEVWIE